MHVSGSGPSGADEGVCYFYGLDAASERCRAGDGSSCAADTPFSTAFFVHEVLSMTPAHTRSPPSEEPSGGAAGRYEDENDDGDFNLFSRVSVDILSPPPHQQHQQPVVEPSASPPGSWLVPRGDPLGPGRAVKVGSSCCQSPPLLLLQLICLQSHMCRTSSATCTWVCRCWFWPSWRSTGAFRHIITSAMHL